MITLCKGDPNWGDCYVVYGRIEWPSYSYMLVGVEWDTP